MQPAQLPKNAVTLASNAKAAKDAVAEIVQHRTYSYQWLMQNFYPQWRKVHRLYKCEVDPATDENDVTTGSTILDQYGRHSRDKRIDKTKTRIGMPDIWSLVRRQVARITAQPPNLKFRADDLELANRISRKLMYDWDRGGVQRIQKRHVTQACLFGISIRAWSWQALEYQRSKRVDPAQASPGTEDYSSIMDQYGDALDAYQQSDGMEPGSPESFAMLMGDYSRGGLLPIKETYKKYEGPSADFLFIGDCFFEPNFQTLQKSRWFIVERRRNKTWLKTMGLRYPDFQTGIEQLLRDFPKGSPDRTYTREAQNLRVSMMGDIDRIDTAMLNNGGDTEMWTVTEEWVPGEECKARFIAEDAVYLGECDSPYDLDGKIPFTELVLIDDILTGIGDSHSRIIRGLNELHNTHNGYRYDLVSALLRPLVATNDRELFDNPDSIKRGDGMRLVFMRNLGSMQPLQEGAAIASAQAGMSDEQGLLRMMQMASGESNMSMAANVDPAQNRTATGARVLAFNQDILSKDATDMFNVSLNADAEMMYLLNRSEMPEAVTFDGARYQRSYTSGPQPGVPGPDPSQPVQLPDGQGQPPPPPGANVPQQDKTTVTPLDFQISGEVEAEVGSTLADDDESELVKAQNLFAMAIANPELFNKQKARDNLLVRFGYAKELAQWQAPPPPPPPPPEPSKIQLSVAAKFELLEPEAKAAIFEKCNIELPSDLKQAAVIMDAAQQSPPGAPPMPPPPPGPMPGPPQAPPHPGRRPPGHMPHELPDPEGPPAPTALGAAEDQHGGPAQ